VGAFAVAVAVALAVAVVLAHGDPSSLCRIRRWNLVPPAIYSVTHSDHDSLLAASPIHSS
jgi:hypothetical protein